MAWSTREIAELAGATLRAVRHYHEIGLLEPPERAENGYKQYGVTHLVRLLRIRRLIALGMSLQQIGELGDLTALPDDDLRRLDEDVMRDIARLEQVHEELQRLLAQAELVDLPPALALAATRATVTDSDRKLLVVLSRVLPPEQLAAVAEVLQWMPSTEATREFDTLPADTPEEHRIDLARRMLPESVSARERFPDLPDLLGLDEPRARQVLETALTEIYNPAQVDVLRRVSALRRDADG